jgi:HSP20 family protein
MPLFPDPFGTLLGLQNTLDAFRRSDWLQSGPSASGSYPPLNVFRKGDDFTLVAELPGLTSSDLDIQVKGRTVRLSGSKSVNYPEKASVHRRERLQGRFDRSITLPIEVDQERATAQFRDGILAITLPRAERDKPRSIRIG